MPKASRETRRIHYEWTRAAAATTQPVILVPGLGGGSKVFGTLPRRFARHGFDCITFDPVGTGQSSPHEGAYHLDAAAADLLAVLDDAGIEHAHFVGTSLGGKVALCAAALAPTRCARLVMLASSAVATPRGQRVYRFFEVLANRLEPGELGEVLATFLFGTSFHTNHPQVINDIVRAMKLDAATRALMIEQARCLHTFDGAARARTLSCPALLLAGAEDTLTGPDTIESTAQLMADATFEVIEGAGHTLLLEAPSVFDRIASFLSA